jgi:hypothetical protein
MFRTAAEVARAWEAAERRRKAKHPAERPVGMMSFTQAMMPEGRAEFWSIFRRPKPDCTRCGMPYAKHVRDRCPTRTP